MNIWLVIGSMMNQPGTNSVDLFGHLNGLFTIHIDKIEEDENEPSVMIMSNSGDGWDKVVEYGKELRLYDFGDEEDQ